MSKHKLMLLGLRRASALRADRFTRHRIQPCLEETILRSSTTILTLRGCSSPLNPHNTVSFLVTLTPRHKPCMVSTSFPCHTHECLTQAALSCSNRDRCWLLPLSAAVRGFMPHLARFYKTLYRASVSLEFSIAAMPFLCFSTRLTGFARSRSYSVQPEVCTSGMQG